MGFIDIKWQAGTEKEAGKNGVQVEEVLGVCRRRLAELNKQFPCRENAITLTKIDEAIMWQKKRTEDRVARGVEGEHAL